ncbi:MAG: acetyltransferase [Bacillaceae bacterium]|nr:acetyltransferase [Bacillaceae bacterium]
MKTLILGAGDQAEVAYHILKNKFEISGFIDIFNNPEFNNKVYQDIKVIGNLNDINQLLKIEQIQVHIAFGDNHYRKKIFLQYKNKVKFINVLHSTSFLHEQLTLGENVFVGPKTIINNDVLIGDNTIINSGAIIEHGCIIGAHTSIGPGVNIAGNVTIDESVTIGIGATVIDDIKIGKGSIIGAGSTVINDIPDNVLAVGSPAKVKKTLK